MIVWWDLLEKYEKEIEKWEKTQQEEKKEDLQDGLTEFMK